MKNIERTIFTIKADEYYKRMVDHSKLKVHDLDMGTLQLADLEDVCDAIWKKVFIWPQIGLNTETVIPQIQTVKPDADVTANLLEGSVSVKNTEVKKIFEIKYPVPFEGSSDALDLTLDKEAQQVLICFNDTMDIIFYTAEEIDEVNEEIKNKRDKLISDITENQQKLNQFFTGKEYELKQIIRSNAEKLFEAAAEQRENIHKLV